MKNKLPLPQDKKLTVIFRIESGCLGPQGGDHVTKFCDYAQKDVESIDSDFVHWEITPRLDKTLAEIEYKIGGKKLPHDKAAKYLGAFNKSLDEFEGHLNDRLTTLIDQYMGH